MAFVFRSPRITNLSQIESNTDPYPKEPSNNSIINSTSSYNSYINKTNTSKKYQKKMPLSALSQIRIHYIILIKKKFLVLDLMKLHQILLKISLIKMKHHLMKIFIY
jgi:hypothetical protein